MIRQANKNDIPIILEIFKQARQFMTENGNPSQWNENYPNQSDIENDIQKRHAYVAEEKGEIIGVFTLIIGPDESYRHIEKGNWSHDFTYGTIHRLASNGKVAGFAHQCFDFCYQKIPYLRIDTHKDNAKMLAAIRQYGFNECGIIHLDDGSPRIAFDFYQ